MKGVLLKLLISSRFVNKHGHHRQFLFWLISKKSSPLKSLDQMTGLTLEGDSGEEVALWLLTSLCSSAKREVEVAL